MYLNRYTAVALLLLAACSQSTSDAPRPKAVPTAPQVTTSPDQDAPRVSEDETTTKGRPRPGEVVYYRTHPDRDKVDRYCGAFDRSYVAEPVDVPPGEQAVLTAALRTLFHEVWRTPRSQVESVNLVDGHATIDLTSTNGLGIASTTCGGVGFMGSILRTAFQFDSVRSVEIRIGGSCKRFGNFMQSLRCTIFTRADLS